MNDEAKKPQKPRRNWRRALAAWGAGTLLFLTGVWTVPHLWCGREAPRWYRGEVELQKRLARGLERWVKSELGTEQFRTGSGQFSGEWLFGTYMMAAMGFGQSALEHPEWRAEHAALMSSCIERMISPKVRAFDTASWKGDDALENLGEGSGHAAYLGYLNLALGLGRLLDPGSEHAALNDRISAALIRRVEASPTLLVETYPGEGYPVDNCAVIASIALHGRAAGRDHGELLRKWSARCRKTFVGGESGLLYQAVSARSGRPEDRPRGSGTALGLYFLSFSHPGLSAELYAAVKRELAGTFLGFGAVREYPRGVRGGRGDIDSGPILFGYGVSPTGFTIGGARVHRDPDYFARVYASAYLVGAPLDRAGRRNHVTGGPLGDAILFAMLTARPAAEEGPGTRP